MKGESIHQLRARLAAFNVFSVAVIVLATAATDDLTVIVGGLWLVLGNVVMIGVYVYRKRKNRAGL